MSIIGPDVETLAINLPIIEDVDLTDVDSVTLALARMTGTTVAFAGEVALICDLVLKGHNLNRHRGEIKTLRDLAAVAVVEAKAFADGLRAAEMPEDAA